MALPKGGEACGKFQPTNSSVAWVWLVSETVNGTGFSPAQWVLGKGPRIPFSLTQSQSLASRDLALSDPSFARRAALQTAARAALTQLDGSQRLRRALLRKSRPGAHPLQQGEQVYFWRRRAGGKKTKPIMGSRWVGPGIVLGQHGSLVWIAYRSNVVKVAPELVRRAAADESKLWGELLAEAEVMRTIAGRLPTEFETVPVEEPDPWAPEGSEPPLSDEGSQDLLDPAEAADPVDFEPEVWPDAAEMPVYSDGPENDCDAETHRGEDSPLREPTVPRPEDYNQPGFAFPEGFPPGYVPPPGYRPYRSSPYEPATASGSVPATPPHVAEAPTGSLPPELGPSPSAPRPPGEPIPKRARVLLCENVDALEAHRSRVTLWTVAAAPPLHKPKGGELRLKDCSPAERKAFETADRAEIDSFFEHDAIVVLGQKEEKELLKSLDPSRIMRARMVRRNKNQGLLDPVSGSGLPFKAKSRLCVLGFADPDDVRTDAPTTSRSGVNTLLALAACLKLKLFSGDVSSAFLNGLNTGGRDLYFRLPPELAPLLPTAQTPKDRGVRPLCRILRGVYGLRDAPRLWWCRLESELTARGLKATLLEPTLFILRNARGGIGRHACGRSVGGCHSSR